MKTKISSRLTPFYRYFFGPMLLALPLILSLTDIKYTSHPRAVFHPILYLILALIFILFLWKQLWNIQEVWKDKEFLYYRKKGILEKVSWDKVRNAWQVQPLRIFRFLYISFENEKGEVQWIKFIGHFEMDLKGKHHPEISVLLKKINEGL